MANPAFIQRPLLVTHSPHQLINSFSYCTKPSSKMASPIEHMSEVLNFASFYKQLASEMASTSRHRLLHAREMDLILENATKDDSEIAAACHRRLDLPISYFINAWRQLLSMMKVWKGVLSARLRYECVGRCDAGREFMEAVLLCELMIPERVRIGFQDAGLPARPFHRKVTHGALLSSRNVKSG